MRGCKRAFNPIGARSLLIGIGRDDWFRSPSLRTGLADFPHPALRFGGSPPRGLTLQRVGRSEREQPLRGKESIRPELIVTLPSTTTALSPFATRPLKPAMSFLRETETEVAAAAL